MHKQWHDEYAVLGPIDPRPQDRLTQQALQRAEELAAGMTVCLLFELGFLAAARHDKYDRVIRRIDQGRIEWQVSHGVYRFSPSLPTRSK